MSVTSTNGFCWVCHCWCRCRYHTVPGRKRRRRASEESAAKKNSLSRALSSIPELGAFARERLTLMVLVTNPAALDAVTRVSGGGWEREHRDGTRVGGAWFEQSVARDGLDLCTYVRRNRFAGGALVRAERCLRRFGPMHVRRSNRLALACLPVSASNRFFTTCPTALRRRAAHAQLLYNRRSHPFLL